MTSTTFEDLNSSKDEEFVDTLKDIFEHSPWVAIRVVEQRPFKSVRGLHGKMLEQVSMASKREQLDLIRAHPDLAGKAALAGDLTDSSTSEQAGAGLDALTKGELEQFHTLNDTYQSRFGFPFILAVKGHDKHSILAAFESRIKNDVDQERIEALKQIGEIARIRLEAMFLQDS